ncbi:hypothetical protein CL634_03060 [bacterium]|nr:hypothetical protein [bacterium]|tara:strand:+ start:606 stop:899 length:294 start_codon:yes stop_codon:yes gene_type:complete
MNNSIEPVEEVSTQVESQPVEQPLSSTVEPPKRGRPKINVDWPEGRFTFNMLTDKNVLSSSSLRKKMRLELKRGGLVKVDTLRTAFGRPQNIYSKNS